jgi:arylsulfatase A-like enzyme
MDRSMGTLRAGLRQLGIADNTLVWFCGDNGGWQDPKKPDANGVTGGLRGRKGDMYEGGIRVPCVIEWPARIKRPVVTEMPAGVVDIYPTKLSASNGQATPAPVQKLSESLSSGPSGKGPLKVFLLAGQSNMDGSPTQAGPVMKGAFHDASTTHPRP